MRNELKIAVSSIPVRNFHQYRGGWPNESSVALLDAVFSMNAKYTTKNRRGVLDKIKLMRDDLDAPDGWHDSLSLLTEIPSARIIHYMGGGLVAPNTARRRTKALAVAEAASTMIASTQLDSASDITSFIERDREKNYKKLQRAYTSIVGLGPVTFEYFLMLLGIPGIKADRMITRFVSGAISETVQPLHARQLISEVHADLREAGVIDCGIIEFEHGIWLFESEKAKR